MDVTERFCDIDNFCEVFIPALQHGLLVEGKGKRKRKYVMHPSEVMSLLILFHCSHYRNFKNYYLHYVPRVLGSEFPNRVSYNRFIELAHSVIIPLSAYLNIRRVTSRGIAFVDSMPLRVCHNKRIPRHKTFKGIAERGKTSMGWFYGFKLHLIIDDRGELVSFLSRQATLMTVKD